MVITIIANQHNVRVVITAVVSNSQFHIGYKSAIEAAASCLPKTKKHIINDPVMMLAGFSQRKNSTGDIFMFVLSPTFPIQIVSFTKIQFLSGSAPSPNQF